MSFQESGFIQHSYRWEWNAKDLFTCHLINRTWDKIFGSLDSCVPGSNNHLVHVKSLSDLTETGHNFKNSIGCLNYIYIYIYFVVHFHIDISINIRHHPAVWILKKKSYSYDHV